MTQTNKVGIPHNVVQNQEAQEAEKALKFHIIRPALNKAISQMKKSAEQMKSSLKGESE